MMVQRAVVHNSQINNRTNMLINRSFLTKQTQPEQTEQASSEADKSKKSRAIATSAPTLLPQVLYCIFFVCGLIIINISIKRPKVMKITNRSLDYLATTTHWHELKVRRRPRSSIIGTR